jgi:hypothetical protein
MVAMVANVRTHSGVSADQRPGDSCQGSTMRREHDWGEDDPSDAYWSWSVRLNLASGAAATAKLTLDAALAGYYSPAYGLLRHLAETRQRR